MINVSIIVVTYNPNYKKEIATIKSILIQKNIEFEIIICDDGSENDYFIDIEKYFSTIGFNNYKLVKNRQNVGTVKNCYSGLKQAKGEYVFCTSPGDMLIDENVLFDFYNFSKEKNKDIVFGDAIYYSYENNNLIIHEKKSVPQKPEVYTEGYSQLQAIVAFIIVNDAILGATYFRRREIMLKYVERILDTSVFVEDGTTSAYALLDGICINYFKREMIAYEYGQGISTCSNSEWDKKINEDYLHTYNKMIEYYPDNSIVKVMKLGKKYKNVFIRRLVQVATHPIIALFRIRYCFIKNKDRNIDYNKMEEKIKEILIKSN